MMIVQTNNGTFGDGVYVADANDEEARGIGCPPDAIDVVNRFQIPEPGRPDPSRVTGWVEFEITRQNFYQIDFGVNSAVQREFIVRNPLFPNLHPVARQPTRVLYMGLFAFGLDLEYVCF